MPGGALSGAEQLSGRRGPGARVSSGRSGRGHHRGEIGQPGTGKGETDLTVWAIALRLGRLSTLPTVWTNALAGGVLGATAAREAAPLWTTAAILLAALSLSLLHFGGTWLYDAFEADADAFAREDKPIPSGAIGRQTVLVGGGLMLAGGVLLAIPLGLVAVIAALALAAALVAFDWLHRQTPLAPLLIGLARDLWPRRRRAASPARRSSARSASSPGWSA